MANVLAIVFFVLGVVATHTCITVWAAVMLPLAVERARRRLEGGPVFCLVCGFVFCLASMGVLVALLPFRSAGFGFFHELLDYLAATVGMPRFSNDHQIATHAVGWLLVSPVMAGWIIGGAALTRIFQARAQQNLSVRTPALALTGGALCMSFAYFLPFVGWFVFLPLVGPMCTGAGLLAIVTQSKSPAARVPSERAEVREVVEA